VSRAIADAAMQYQHTFDGKADQVAQVRRQITAYLDGCRAAQDAVLIASELAANAVLHSASAGEFFTVRCQIRPGSVWIEVQDLGGPWQPSPPGDRLHGLDIIHALTGPGNWGTRTTSDGDRIVWARLHLAGPSPRWTSTSSLASRAIHHRAGVRHQERT
jgi:anti-sigma regulatory factor (Ser/Thr protein kinase)